jgi:hypothetical protein
MSTSRDEKIDEDIWICDSGAIGHYCLSTDGVCNLQDIDEEVTVVNGDKMMATKIESLGCCVIQVDVQRWTL